MMSCVQYINVTSCIDTGAAVMSYVQSIDVTSYIDTGVCV